MRVVEIDPEIDFDSRRAVYFRQMRYGLYVGSFTFLSFPASYLTALRLFPCSQIRMALLVIVLG